MAAVHPLVLIIVGAIISTVAWINPEARAKLILFFWVGIALCGWGVLKLLWWLGTRKRKKQTTAPVQGPPDGVPRQNRVPVQASHPSMAHQNHPQWHHARHDSFPQQQRYAHHSPQQPSPGSARCPNCGHPKNASHRFCPNCGYGV